MRGSRRSVRLSSGLTGLVRRRSRRAIVALTILSLTMVVGVPLLSAAVVLSDDETTIPAGQVIAEDAYIFGDEVTIDGQASHDIVSATNTFTMGDAAVVAGNLNVSANEVRLAGTVERSARLAARDIVIRGAIGGDVVVAAQSVRIEAGSVVTGDLLVAAQDVTVLGAVQGEIRGSADTLSVTNGVVGENVLVTVDELTIDGTSQVGGAIRYESDSDATVADTAAVSGPIERSGRNAVSAGDFSVSSGLAWDLARLLSMLVTGLVVVLVAPEAVTAVADGVRRRLPATVIAGVAALILIPILAALLIVTLVGIPVSIVAVVLYVIALYLSQVFVGLAIGRTILPRSWRSDGRGYNLLAMVIGVVLIGLLRLIPIPFLDLVVAIVVALLGLGALFTAVRSNDQAVGAELPTSQFGDPYYGVPTRS